LSPRPDTYIPSGKATTFNGWRSMSPVVLIAEELAPAALEVLADDFDVRHVDGTDRPALLSALAHANGSIVRTPTHAEPAAGAVSRPGRRERAHRAQGPPGRRGGGRSRPPPARRGPSRRRPGQRRH